MPLTPRMIEALTTWRSLGGPDVLGAKIRTAEKLGVSYRRCQQLIAKALEYESLPEGVQHAISATATHGAARAGWRKIRHEDGSGESVYWRTPEPQADPGAWVEAIREGLADLRAAPARIASPPSPLQIMAVFPVADLHVGMLADPDETGTAWDSKIGGRVFADAFERLVRVAPAGDCALLAQLGDLTHTDDQRNVTPQSGHQLDADTRFFKVLRSAVATMKAAIETLRERYPRVIYRGQRGNHDMNVHHAVTLALAEHYRDCPDVEIAASPADVHVREWGRTLLVLHHGDRIRPDRLAHFVAAEYPAQWGRTRHRLALSGHVHHQRVHEVGGLVCESVGTIVPRDAWARSHGYTARRGLVAIALHREDGEIGRCRVGVGP
ncbi:hypothetical protein [Rubellimicrobium sp. CFH 75288]|uniref:hypothetical protein n=1 Tax=Rubellimicrobium sp. CFH 75288 TaxID=2697034 RepID=UPI001412CF64|nr:hypothetical protein [Rubellimicrobium sp. CFH 75288]NAZ37132.1 hypothetical protein [Rubellimicrobium sp. CFH 75288]